jgi:hypothetical protein
MFKVKAEKPDSEDEEPHNIQRRMITAFVYGELVRSGRIRDNFALSLPEPYGFEIDEKVTKEDLDNLSLIINQFIKANPEIFVQWELRVSNCRIAIYFV